MATGRGKFLGERLRFRSYRDARDSAVDPGLPCNRYDGRIFFFSSVGSASAPFIASAQPKVVPIKFLIHGSLAWRSTASARAWNLLPSFKFPRKYWVIVSVT